MTRRKVPTPDDLAEAFDEGVLDLSGGRWTDLPPEIGRLDDLHRLLLSDNELTTLPAEIFQLTRLRVLNLGGNPLGTLPPEIGQLTALETLWVGGTGLRALPQEISRLVNLRRIDLTVNRFTEVPRVLFQLPHLDELHLGENQIEELPSQLASLLRRGVKLSVDPNPLREPLPELMERGADALMAYLSSLDDADELYEAKMILVGEGNVGKTCLVDALRGEPFVAGRPTTHGIEISILDLPHPDRPDTGMTVRAWDFGGQEVYRITHQFFFSTRAVYLVVWKAREGQEQNEVEGWLRRIRLRVKADAPALIVATHCDERHPELAYTQLQRAMPELVAGRHAVDSHSGTGVAELRDAIAAHAAALPQMGQRINRRWKAVRDELRSIVEPHIQYARYAKACRRHKLTGDEETTLIALLHDLGQVIYYGADEGLRDLVVLNPDWLTKAISFVLEDRPTRAAGGVLDHARLREIWSERYPPAYHPFFLRLMEKFDVCYRLADDENRSLVGQLVPEDEPDLPWDLTTPLPDGVRVITLVCRFGEQPPGLIPWLTVRHHGASTGRHWSNGVFLRYPVDAYASEALLRVNRDAHLTLQVRAPSPDLFFNVLRDSVEHLARTRWPGLTYKLYVPCPTPGCAGQFPLDGLLRFRERGGDQQNCLDCQADHGVAELLTGFATPPAATLAPELRQLHREISTVAAGVERVERYAAQTASEIRRVIKAVGTEVTDCPRLFTLAGQSSLIPWRQHYHLTLWCEHPDHWHPCDGADYEVRMPREWFVEVAPYASLVFTTLRLVVPIAGAVAGVALSEERLKDASARIELMKTLVDKLPAGLEADRPDVARRKTDDQLSEAEGHGLRGLRRMLFELDPPRRFGGLRRVQAPSGEFLWVCPAHHREYDPGLPSIPPPGP